MFKALFGLILINIPSIGMAFYLRGMDGTKAEWLALLTAEALGGAYLVHSGAQ